MEVIALIMAVFAALLAVERRKKGAWHRDDPNTDDLDENEPDIIAGVGYTAPNTPVGAYHKARKAAKSPVVERGRFKIAGKHGAYIIRERTSKATATLGTVHTLRQAKEWMWCLHNGWNYDDVKKAYRNLKGSASRRARLERQRRADRRRDVALMAAESGYHNFYTDSEGNRTYYAGEWGTRSRGYGSRGYH